VNPSPKRKNKICKELILMSGQTNIQTTGKDHALSSSALQNVVKVLTAIVEQACNITAKVKENSMHCPSNNTVGCIAHPIILQVNATLQFSTQY